MTTGAFIYLVISFITAIIAIEILHHIERRNLYRYIKADTLKEAERGKNPIERSPSGHRGAIKKWRSGGRNE